MSENTPAENYMVVGPGLNEQINSVLDTKVEELATPRPTAPQGVYGTPHRTKRPVNRAKELKRRRAVKKARKINRK